VLRSGERPQAEFAPQFNLASPEHLADPHPLYHRMREQAPVYRSVHRRSGLVYWYLTRYADVHRALLDQELGRQLDRLPPELAARHRQWDFDPLGMLRQNVFNLDPPDHTRLHRLIAPSFSARAVAVTSQCIPEFVDELIDELAASGGEVDVITALALPMAIRVIAELIGFPLDSVVRLRWWSHLLRSGDPVRARTAGFEFIAYFDEVIYPRCAGPGEDLLSRLIHAEQAGQLSHIELIASVFQLLLAGDETTVNLIGNAVVELLRHPGELARLRAQPGLIGSAVEEVVRFNGPVGHSRYLYALADVKIGEAEIPRGDVVVPVLLAANRDPAVFPDPDAFDITRSPNRHLGFGRGSHFCLGAEVARLQARAAIGSLLRRFPGLALAVSPAELEWKPDLFLHGMHRVPVLL
jgi:cytochrome P450